MGLTANKGFLEAASVTIDKDTSTIKVTGGIDCSFVASGTAIFLDGSKVLVEGISGTSANPDGSSTITIRNKWTADTLTAVTMTAFNTIEGLRDAIREARKFADGNNGTAQLAEFLTSGNRGVTLDIAGNVITTTPYGWLLPKVQGLLDSITDGTLFDGGTY